MVQMPDWEAILNAWPLIAAIAGVWARVEVALANAKTEARHHKDEVVKLDRELTALRATIGTHGEVAAKQAVQLGRIEEALVGIASTLTRLEHRIDRERP